MMSIIFGAGHCFLSVALSELHAAKHRPYISKPDPNLVFFYSKHTRGLKMVEIVFLSKNNFIARETKCLSSPQAKLGWIDEKSGGYTAMIICQGESLV